MEVNTYNSFDDISEKDAKTLSMVIKYIGKDKKKTIHSYKTFWKKYEGIFYVIGEGSYDEPQYYIGLQVQNPQYVGQPYKIYLSYWYK